MPTTQISRHLQEAKRLAETDRLSIIVYLIDVALRALTSGRGGGKFGEVLKQQQSSESGFQWPSRLSD